MPSGWCGAAIIYSPPCRIRTSVARTARPSKPEGCSEAGQPLLFEPEAEGVKRPRVFSPHFPILQNSHEPICILKTEPLSCFLFLKTAFSVQQIKYLIFLKPSSITSNRRSRCEHHHGWSQHDVKTSNRSHRDQPYEARQRKRILKI